jgi:hypothetical protein
MGWGRRASRGWLRRRQRGYVLAGNQQNVVQVPNLVGHEWARSFHSLDIPPVGRAGWLGGCLLSLTFLARITLKYWSEYSFPVSVPSCL